MPFNTKLCKKTEEYLGPLHLPAPTHRKQSSSTVPSPFNTNSRSLHRLIRILQTQCIMSELYRISFTLAGLILLPRMHVISLLFLVSILQLFLFHTNQFGRASFLTTFHFRKVDYIVNCTAEMIGLATLSILFARSVWILGFLVSYWDGIVARNCCSGVMVMGIVIGILHLLRRYPVNVKVSTPIPFPSVCLKELLE